MNNEPKTELVELLKDTPQDVNTVYLHPTARNATIAQQASQLDPRARAAAEAYCDSPDRLHGDKLASATILVEKPTHRLMIYLHAMGKTAADIAKQMDYEPTYVTQILRQPWAKLRLTQILKEAGIDEVKHFLTTEVSPSLQTLKVVRDTAPKPSDRAAAANAILDRALGKPTVHVETDNTNRTVPADLQRLEADIAATKQQLKSMGHESRN